MNPYCAARNVSTASVTSVPLQYPVQDSGSKATFCDICFKRLPAYGPLSLISDIHILLFVITFFIFIVKYLPKIIVIQHKFVKHDRIKSVLLNP